MQYVHSAALYRTMAMSEYLVLSRLAVHPDAVDVLYIALRSMVSLLSFGDRICTRCAPHAGDDAGLSHSCARMRIRSSILNSSCYLMTYVGRKYDDGGNGTLDPPFDGLSSFEM